MAVKFLRDASVGAHYNEGEVAGFSPEVEASLIKQEVAEKFEAKKPDPKPEQK